MFLTRVSVPHVARGIAVAKRRTFRSHRYSIAPWLPVVVILAGVGASGSRLSSPQPKAPPQVWEKSIAPGLVYRMEYDPSRPMVLNALRWTLKAPSVHAEPELAGGTVYEEGSSTKGRGTVTQMVAETHALAGINADFFPFTGHPLGLTVKDGQLLSLPRPERSAFAWGPDQVQIGMAKFSGQIQVSGGPTIPIDGLNEEAKENGVVVDDDMAGLALAPKSPSVTVVLKVDNPTFVPSTSISGSVELVEPDESSLAMKKGDVFLVGQGSKAALLANLRPGQKVTIQYQTSGFDWERIENVVGGGPVLMKDGKIAVGEEGFDKKSFVDMTHPRSAVGRTADGDIWWVTIDGRQETGSGVSLADLAAQMRRLGCVDAMNLDGGGSTTLNVLGVTVNRPSDGTERPVADGVVFEGPAPALSDVQLKILAPESLSLSNESILEVLDASGARVPNREVIWGAQGAAWIDQGGLLRPLKSGTAHVQASVRGRILAVDVKVG